MDKEGQIKKHSQEKLLVYKKYLIEYLSVLTNQPYYNQILIWDIFAGKGKDDKGTKGSALIAAEQIKDFRDKTGKNIRLFLNELNKANYQQLCSNLENYHFTKVFNKNGEDFLKEINHTFKNKNYKIHNFFFIDPHGYTQYSTSTLKELLNLKSSEYLIFIPTNHIYRFLKALNENNPAAQFVHNLEMKKKDFKDANSFVKELEKILKKITNSHFVYSYKIENKEAKSNFYHLLFITKHIIGAEKFLEAINKVKRELLTQLSLFDDLDKENEVKTYLKDWRNNKEIYEWGIRIGLLPKEINPILKDLENKDKLEIGADKKRRKGSFYLKSNEIKINVKIK